MSCELDVVSRALDAGIKGDVLSKADKLHSEAENFLNQNSHQAALQSFQQAASLIESSFNNVSPPVSLSGVRLFNNIASTALYLNQIDEAISFFKKSLELNNSNDYPFIWLASAFNLAQCYQRQKQLSEAQGLFSSVIDFVLLSSDRENDEEANQAFFSRISENKEIRFKLYISIFIMYGQFLHKDLGDLVGGSSYYERGLVLYNKCDYYYLRHNKGFQEILGIAREQLKNITQEAINKEKFIPVSDNHNQSPIQLKTEGNSTLIKDSDDSIKITNERLQSAAAFNAVAETLRLEAIQIKRSNNGDNLLAKKAKEEEALTYYKKALQITKSKLDTPKQTIPSLQRDPFVLAANICNNLGTFYADNLEDFENALKSFEEASSFGVEDNHLYASIYFNIASIHTINKKFDLARTAHERSLKHLVDFYGSNTNHIRIANQYVAIATCELQLDDNFITSENDPSLDNKVMTQALNSALQLLSKASEIYDFLLKMNSSQTSLSSNEVGSNFNDGGGQSIETRIQTCNNLIMVCKKNLNLIHLNDSNPADQASQLYSLYQTNLLAPTPYDSIGTVCINCQKSNRQSSNEAEASADNQTNQTPQTLFKVCSACKKATYCSRECQQKHWKTHKIVCKAPVKADQ